MKIEYIGENIVTILNQLLSNQKLVKYLSYIDKSPLSNADVTLPATGLMFKNVFPYPFNPNINEGENVQLRVYYMGINFDNMSVIERTSIIFDVVVGKDFWAINDGSESLRPYEMAKEIINNLDRINVGQIGQLRFEKMATVLVDEKYAGLRLFARMDTIAG